MEKTFYNELIETLLKKKFSKQDLHKLKIKLCKKHKVKKIPTDIQILLHANPEQISKLNLITKPTRTISGVAVIAVMSYPFSCPHGKCTVCPGGPSSIFGDVPQSYTGKEPATMRAIRNNYNAYLQVMNRLEHYIVMGHVPDKVELIVMGGTFPSFKKSYQEKFITDCFQAMNDFSKLFFIKNKFNFKKFKKFFELPGNIEDKKRTKSIQKRLLRYKKKSLLTSEQKRNEKSNIRCVGLTLETRPDYAFEKQANEMLRLGATRVELGIQSVYEKPLKSIKRGHSVKDSTKSIRILKDMGFKINAHYMLGLPGTTQKQDLEGLKHLFENPDFKPDMLKIYPCMVMEGTKLYNQWKKKKYKPLTTKQAANIIANFKKSVPEYVRIMRVQRDIPTYMTAAGVDKTNLRQYVHEILKKNKIKCRCIRCREAGRGIIKSKPRIIIREYEASEGIELFISAEADDYVLGFLRLRFPSKQLRKEITKDSVLIRELHVYGPAVKLGKKGSIQHKGIGKLLLKTAEQITKQSKKKKIVIISGIGVRKYYKKLGYRKQGQYMVKNL